MALSAGDVSPNAIGSLKLLAAFAVATLVSLAAAVGLHTSGTLASASSSVARDLTAPQARLEPASGERKTSPTPKSEPKIEPAPVVAPPAPTQLARLAQEAKPPKVVPVSLMTPLQRPSGEPFQKLLEDNMHSDLPKAIPLPMVYQGVLAGDDEFLRGLLISGFNANELAPDGDTALCAAVRAGRESTINLLLGHGAAVDQPGREGQLPAALACLKRDKRLLLALIAAGADPNTKFIPPVSDELLKTVTVDDLRHHLRQDRGVTLLMACAARGDVEAVVMLMKHSANTEVSTKKFNRYALDFAAEQHYLFLMRVLLGRPADVEPDLLVTVNLTKQRAWIEKGGKVIDSTMVSTGREGYSTPPGRYVVTDKHKEWTSTLYKASMPWFMRLNCSAVGLHAGYVTGHPASHGCVRLPPEKAKEWFKIVGVGDEVQIVE